MNRCWPLAIVLLFVFSLTGQADDWPQFRGPGGTGVAQDSDGLPSAWSANANLAWKTELPGPGASSPIIVGDRAFVTCYSGYGLSQESPGEIENLVRHLVCIDKKSGKKLWQKDVKASLPEDPYSGIGVTAHGYASHTPVSDGENVYAFFGKSGVYAYDMDGNELWHADVGNESDPTKWGSSSSPILHDDKVIITASAESQAVVGLDKKTGKELWRQEAQGLDGMWGTPTVIKIDDSRSDIVMCVAKEFWGLDPESGKLRWFADATGSRHAYSSLVHDGSRVFAITGRGGGSIALDAGGSGDISESATVWTGRDTASFASPVKSDAKIYYVANKILTVVDAETGKRIEQVRLKGSAETGGRFGSLDYPSPIIAGDRLYYLNGSGQMYVFEIGDNIEQIALNRVTSDKETFWGTPAVSDDQMLMRSSKYLYCVADKGETVEQDETLLAKAGDADSTEPQAGGRPGGGRPGGGAGRGGAGRGAGGGGRRGDPMAMFNGLDSNSDGKVTEDELEGNRMADRLKTLDKDGDKSISKDEFSTGIATLFRGEGGAGRGGRGGGGGGGGYRGQGQDSRPDRPQRPESAGS